MEKGVSVLYLEPCALPEETLIVSCCHCRGNTAMNGAGLGIDRPAELSKNDDEYDAYRKRMMLAYRFRPNPLVTTVALLQCWHFKLFFIVSFAPFKSDCVSCCFHRIIHGGRITDVEDLFFFLSVPKEPFPTATTTQLGCE